MQLVKPITNNRLLFILSLFIFSGVHAQENAPFSRYGLGDLYPSQSIASRGMGGVSAGFVDGQAINTLNPASYGEFRFIQGNVKGGLVTYDFGLSVDARTLHSNSPLSKYNSTNFIPSYIQLGVPLSTKHLGLVFGLRPATRINYSIQKNERTDIDSMQTLFEGSGGLNQVYFGLGKKWKNFSIGFNTGFEFGRKAISTKINFINDSVLYYKSNSQSTTNFWGFFFNPGVSYNINFGEKTNTTTKLKEGYTLHLGASATLEHKLDANENILRQTFAYDENGGTYQIDSVYSLPNHLGKITLPVTWNAGFVLNKMYTEYGAKKWGVGVDYSFGQWTNYRFFDQPDKVNDSWMIHAGGEFSPNPITSAKFWNRATYRLGYYTGKDFIDADGNGYKVSAVTFGFGFNIKKWHSYDNQFSQINTAFEIGKRGTNVNNVTENFFKVSFGLSLSDLWFIKRKYD